MFMGNCVWKIEFTTESKGWVLSIANSTYLVAAWIPANCSVHNQDLWTLTKFESIRLKNSCGLQSRQIDKNSDGWQQFVRRIFVWQIFVW